MATKQTRRSISVRGTTYDKLRQYGETQGRSMSDIVEELLAKILDQPGDVPPPPSPRPDKAPVRAVDKAPARMRFNPPPRPRPTLANRVVRAVAPPPSSLGRPLNRPPLPGRPAPTPASAVTGTKRANGSEKDDYRTIRF